MYTRPDEPPQIRVAANGPSTAQLAAEYADGFITVVKGEEYTRKLAPAVRGYAEDAGRDPGDIETTLLVIVSYDPDYERAFDGTRPWWATTQNVFDRALSNPREIEAEGARATTEQIEQKFFIADSPEQIAERLREYADMGFDRIALGNTSPEPERFFRVMGDEVLPEL